MAMSITVKFLPATNTLPARMRVFSWLTKPTVVNYPARAGFDASDIQACARYAANVALSQINEICAEHGVSWALGQYLETYDGDRVFGLIDGGDALRIEDGLDHPVEVKRGANGRFTVRYGQQIRKGLSVNDAATEIGLSVIHSANCASRLINGE